MINRSLKRDAESSRRQLYIRTYAVTPLNEECGIIEWVDGLKTLRDILLEQYRQIGKTPDYMTIKQKMKDAVQTPESIKIFTEGVLGEFPPRLHHWFIQQFPHPAAWFAARIRYTRSSAVMSMVGTILGLGDRHAENVLLEKDTGGIFHVDFNCLFDKGKTFAEPERGAIPADAQYGLGNGDARCRGSVPDVQRADAGDPAAAGGDAHDDSRGVHLRSDAGLAEAEEVGAAGRAGSGRDQARAQPGGGQHQAQGKGTSTTGEHPLECGGARGRTD